MFTGKLQKAADYLLYCYMETDTHITSLEFKNTLRMVVGPNIEVIQKDVSDYLIKAYEDGKMKNYRMEDNGTYRIYVCLNKVFKIPWYQSILNFLQLG